MFGDGHHVLVLQTEFSGHVNQGFHTEHHPRLEPGIPVFSEIRLLVEEQADAMSYKTDWGEAEFPELFQISPIDASRARAVVDSIEDDVPTSDEIVPNPLYFRRNFLDHCRPTDSSMISLEHAENLQSDEIAAVECSLRRTDVRVLTSLPGCNDEKFEMFGSQSVYHTG